MRVLFSVLLLAGIASAAPPELSDEVLLPKLRQKLGSEPDYFERNVKRMGHRTITLEVTLSTHGEYALARDILPDIRGWPGWALEKINERPDGTKYLIQVLGLEPMPDPAMMLAKLFIDIPVFRQKTERALHFKSERGPASATVEVETLPSETGLIEVLRGVGRVFPAEGRADRIWFYFQGEVKLRSWLVYEALPERLLKRETGDRIRRIMDNYVREEDRVSLVRRSQSPTEKKAKPDASQSLRPRK